MVKETVKICNTEELGKISSLVNSHYVNDGRNVVLLYGHLGSGKTACVKNYVSTFLGQNADSPTFALVNTYKGKEQTVHHFDLYRLNDLEEIEEIGFWDYLDDGSLCFIEWPEKIAELLPIDKTVRIDIELLLDKCRNYSLSY